MHRYDTKCLVNLNRAPCLEFYPGTSLHLNVCVSAPAELGSPRTSMTHRAVIAFSASADLSLCTAGSLSFKGSHMYAVLRQNYK
jgi:hypothetical protein